MEEKICLGPGEKENVLAKLKRAAVDLCNHLIAVLKLRSPESYTDTFKVLEEHQVFDKDFGQRLTEMAKFRNRLVHFYFAIDDNLRYEILQEGPKDLGKFLEDLTQFIKKSPGELS